MGVRPGDQTVLAGKHSGKSRTHAVKYGESLRQSSMSVQMTTA